MSDELSIELYSQLKEYILSNEEITKFEIDALK